MTAFKPYPHTANGRFYWGRVVYKYGDADQPEWANALRAGAPLLVALLLILVNLWLLESTGSLFALVWGFCAATDFLFNLIRGP